MTAPTEAECQATIVEAARLGGFLVMHTRPARTAHGWGTPIQGDKGFVDLVIVGHGRVMFIELKRRPNKLTPAQVRWQHALLAADVDYRQLWVPDDLTAFCAELIGARREVIPSPDHPSVWNAP